ncbi:MAG: hypothetical protein KAT78_06300, partial [Flavobacteriaceae bacterium]|nr:hypothetical protein [Flavobacteriaceae bacterium]
MKKIIFIIALGLGVLWYYLNYLSPQFSIYNYSTSKNNLELNLSKTCPPGFQLNEKNQCISRNLYQQYKSLED